jgi:NTE family protein
MNMPTGSRAAAPVRRDTPALACILAALAALLATRPAPLVAATAGDRPKTCLVLSGGGARGAAHVGVLKVLEELRVPIDCVVGTSMGSIVGASWVSGTTTAEMEDALKTANWDVVLGDEPARPRRSWRSKELERERAIGAEIGVGRKGALLPGGAVIGQQLEGFLQRLLGPPVTRASFDELPVPFRAIATDITTGKMVVLDKGSLNAAVRASMSVPGAFAPQEIGGQLLVDGGLVRNLGVDIARKMGAERVIAVNLGTTLMPREQVESLVGVTAQMINILTDQNVNTSLAELRPTDILITPELGDYSAANFKEAWTTVEIGERAARQVAERLATFGIAEDAWQAWRASRLPPRTPVPPESVAVKLDTSGLKHVDPASVQAVFEDTRATVPPAELVDRAVEALYATDDFQQVTLRTESRAGQDTVIIEPREKSWGPNYLRFGTSLSTNLEGESGFNLYGDLRATWLNRKGLEWRTSVAIGDVMGMRTELLQPVDLQRRWLGSVYLDGRRRVDPLFLDDEAVATYSNSVLRAGLGIRSRFFTDSEVLFALQRSWYDLRRESGIDYGSTSQSGTAALLRYTVDRLDDWDFPRAGIFASASYEESFDVFGDDVTYRKGSVELQKAFGEDRHSLALAARHGNAFGSELPLVEAFPLGGFQNLSGFADRQFQANRVTFGRAVYAYQLPGGGAVAKSFYVGGSVEAGEVAERLNVAPRTVVALDDLRRNWVTAGSLFLSADTPLGPLYLAVGFGEGGERAYYLFLGRP